MSTLTVPTTDPELTGFTYVKKKSRPGRTSRKAQNKTSVSKVIDSLDLPQLRQKYASRRDILLRSQFFQDFRVLFSDLLSQASFVRPGRLQMLGIGTLTHPPSQTQLAFGIALADLLEIPCSQVRTSDPMYTALDGQFLKELGLLVQTVEVGNDHSQDPQGKEEDGIARTLIFAPHVPKSVYESILRAHWIPRSRHGQLVLLGNNLLHYPDIYSDARLTRESPAILNIGTHLTVVPLPGNFEHNNVFNDLALQWIKADAELPELDFSQSQIEKERFEINQDDV